MKLSYAVIFHIFPPPGIDSATYSMNFKFEYKFTKKYELFFSCFFFSFELFELRKQKNIHMLDYSLRYRKAESRFNFLKKMGRKRRITPSSQIFKFVYQNKNLHESNPNQDVMRDRTVRFIYMFRIGGRLFRREI